MKIYAERASGTQMKKRSEFVKMIKACKQRRIEIKLAYLIQKAETEYSRSGRNKGFSAH